MGKLETLPDGRHRITGGFSTKNPEDVELLRPMLAKSIGLDGTPKKPKAKKESKKEAKPKEKVGIIKKIKRTVRKYIKSKKK